MSEMIKTLAEEVEGLRLYVGVAKNEQGQTAFRKDGKTHWRNYIESDADCAMLKEAFVRNHNYKEFLIDIATDGNGILVTIEFDQGVDQQCAKIETGYYDGLGDQPYTAAAERKAVVEAIYSYVKRGSE